jgi:hypothetical protein
MKKFLLLGMMMTWGAAAAAQDGGGNTDQCGPSTSPAIQQTNVATVERNSDSNSAVIQLDIVASRPDGGTLDYAFSSVDGTITSDGARATWTVDGAGPFTADVAVTAADSGCTTHSHFTYHMEQASTE